MSVMCFGTSGNDVDFIVAPAEICGGRDNTWQEESNYEEFQ